MSTAIEDAKRRLPQMTSFIGKLRTKQLEIKNRGEIVRGEITVSFDLLPK